jgi:hypothetical protein
MSDVFSTLAAIEMRLARLEEIEAIKGVIARYTDGADKRNDPAIMGPLFHDDAVWEAEGFGRHQGATVIAAALAEIARTQITWSIHFMVLPTITIAPGVDRARCQWYLWELAKMLDESGVPRDTWFAAKYDSTLVKGAQGWQFDWLLLKPLLNSPVGAPWPIPSPDLPTA